jgi:hypothetical protein
MGRVAARARGAECRWWLWTVILAAFPAGALPAEAATPLVRAAYVYDYMDVAHLDSLASTGFNRAIIRLTGDTPGFGGAPVLRAWVRHGLDRGVEPVPESLLQGKSRLRALSTSRRYSRGPGRVSSDAGCPLDSLFWRSALLDRLEEVLQTVPDARRIAVDLEFPPGAPRHYEVGPCCCPECLAEYTGVRNEEHGGHDAWRFSGLLASQEARLARILGALLGEFAARHPGIEVGVFDLDLDSFVHRACARALSRSGVPTVDYCERSYSTGGVPLRGARARLRALGLATAPLVGGLWLKHFTPGQVPAELRSIAERGEGSFIFTTYSLWRDPETLTGSCTLMGSPADYRRVLAEGDLLP